MVKRQKATRDRLSLEYPSRPIGPRTIPTNLSKTLGVERFLAVIPYDGPQLGGEVVKPQTRRELYGPVALPTNLSLPTKSSHDAPQLVSSLPTGSPFGGSSSPSSRQRASWTNWQWCQKAKDTPTQDKDASRPANDKRPIFKSAPKKSGVVATFSKKLVVVVSNVMGDKSTPPFILGNIRGRGTNLMTIGRKAKPKRPNQNKSHDE